jgi:membrane protease YdiL (CAAX protease family)
VRDATRFQLSLLGIVVGIVLAILPSIGLIDSFKSSSWRTHLPETLWLLCAVGGAFGAGFSSGYFTKETWKSLGLCLATAGAIGCGLMASAFLVKALVQKAPLSLSWSQARVGVASFLTYVPICFVLEEVTFRGAIDAHVHQPGDRYPWLSALIVSCLWGLWHVPIVGGKTIASVVALVILMPLVHSLIGVFLSFSWRRSGNLAVPALVHAFIDGVRNMLLK